MRLSSCCIALTLVLSAGAALADDKKAPAKADNEPSQIDVKFADGSNVKMTLLQDALEVKTRYGKLTIAVKDIRRIDFGLRVSAEDTRRIESAIARLGGFDFKDREAASAELIALRELGYPAVLRATKSSDVEVANRAKQVVGTLREKVPQERLNLKSYDVIQTSELTVNGTIEPATLKARSTYFGEVEIKLADVRSLRTMNLSGESEVVVDASKHGLVQEQWMDTGIELGSGCSLEVNASGSVDLYPIGAETGMYVTNPGGSNQWNGGRGQYPSGALLGRIGERGKVFLVGQKFEGSPTEEGKLYLRIVHSPWNNVPSGSYKVKIMVGK